VDDFSEICADGTTTLHLLSNDYDPNGNAITSLTIIDNVDHGSLVNASLGVYVYTPNPGFTGNDSLLYRICDNGTPSLCDTGMAIIIVHPTPIITASVSSITNCSGDSVN